MDVGKLVSRIIQVGFLLASTGLLVKAAQEIKHEALMSNQSGLISLKAWNRTLESSK